MEQKNINEYEKKYEFKDHPSIKGLKIIEGKNNYPISSKEGLVGRNLYTLEKSPIKNYLNENTAITNPIKQLKDLEEIRGLIQEGQLKDLEPEVLDLEISDECICYYCDAYENCSVEFVPVS